ncbi:hypothetical protein HDK90DRAFT_492294 [Phyllosticta capitalensis]|uniref:Uncharacterized protein n=1 Tax=Phyllosticta capitalensis TaxID=121624 RepID=A0ABR1YG62_9PEZI
MYRYVPLKDLLVVFVVVGGAPEPLILYQHDDVLGVPFLFGSRRLLVAINVLVAIVSRAYKLAAEVCTEVV